MKYFTLIPLLCSLASAHTVEDRLVSRRLHKRGIDVDGHYNISIYHINDVHAHLDQFRASGNDCTEPTKGCYGGYARVKEVLDKERPTKEESLFLNAGDEFQGTLFYTFYGGDKIAETLNQLGFDAMTIGNHEFDGGDDKLAAFLTKLNFPAISANIHTNNTALASKLVPYKIFPKHKLAVVAVTTETTPDISNPGPGTTFEDPLTAIQRTVDVIKQKEGVDRIIALTHIGYDNDIKLAKNTKGISLIIGGHSHTPLGDFPGAVGDYPTIAQNLDGDEVFIVTAYRWGEYLGYIDVAYDDGGKIVGYSGAPIHLTNQTAQDPDLQAQINEWRKPFDDFSREVVGESKVFLQKDSCQREECPLGDLMADAMLYYRKASNPAVDFAIINSGGIRAEIDAGPITRGEVLTAFPFGNLIVELTITGEELYKTFEGTVSHVSEFNGRPVTSFIQVSEGIRIEFNPANALGSRLISLQIGGKPVLSTGKYVVVTLDFIAGGGDNIFLKKDDVVTLNTQDEVLIQYLQKKSPVDPKVEGRIVVTEKTSRENPEVIATDAPAPTSYSGSNSNSYIRSEGRSRMRRRSIG